LIAHLLQDRRQFSPGGRDVVVAVATSSAATVAATSVAAVVWKSTLRTERWCQNVVEELI
jgi:hypothetical protein